MIDCDRTSIETKIRNLFIPTVRLFYIQSSVLVDAVLTICSPPPQKLKVHGTCKGEAIQKLRNKKLGTLNYKGQIGFRSPEVMTENKMLLLPTKFCLNPVTVFGRCTDGRNLGAMLPGQEGKA